MEFYLWLFGPLWLMIAIIVLWRLSARGRPSIEQEVLGPIVEAVRYKYDEYEAGKARIYNDLPVLGQVRVNRERAVRAKYGGSLTAGIAMLAVGFINPTFWLASVYFIGRWGVNNWKEYDLAIREADEQRRRILKG